VSAAAAAAAGVEQPQPQLSQQQPPLEQQQQQPAKKKKVSNFINRVIFGIILGFGGAAVVAKGSLLYLCATMFVVYHATQEFYGFLTSSGISQGMPPPSPFVSVATTALCLSITVFTYFRCVSQQQQQQSAANRAGSSVADRQQHTAVHSRDGRV
jgi:phosphatidate cytidylyltransferase